MISCTYPGIAFIRMIDAQIGYCRLLQGTEIIVAGVMQTRDVAIESNTPVIVLTHTAVEQ